MKGLAVEPRTPAAIAQEIACFEAAHAVTDWECYGWKVWPFLRTSVARWALDQQHCTPALCGSAGAADPSSPRLRGYRQVVARYWQERQVNRGTGATREAGADVLVVAGPTRRQWIGGHWVHLIADPLVDCLERQGLRCIVWQSGEPRQPSRRPARHVSASGHLAYLLTRRLAGYPVPKSPPAWFSPFAALCQSLAAPAPKWPELARSIRYISIWSDIVRRRIKAAGVRIVMVDCWTEWLQLATVIAARQEGLDVVDVQHGIQEHGHPSYHYWTVAPDGGWQALPNLFWVWGEKARELCKSTNAIETEVICGGNPWLNAWRDQRSRLQDEISTARQGVSCCGRAILVTMSRPAWRQVEYVEAAVRCAPPDWAWFIRVHPSTTNSEREAMRRRLAASCPGRIKLDEGSDLPLYDLLNATDVHVSIESTACLEALAFGKPSVIISSRGAQMFRQYVDAGVMYFVPRPQDLRGVLEQAVQLPGIELIREGDRIFAGPESTEAACRELYRRLDRRGGEWREAATARTAEPVHAARVA